MKKELPTTIAQDAVLTKLGLLSEVKGYESAKALLEELGLEAWTEGRGAKRQIKVAIVDREYGAFNQYGEGETWQLAIRKIDLTPISEWIINPEHPRAPKPEPEPPTPTEEPKQWGGKREGAGRPVTSDKVIKVIKTVEQIWRQEGNPVAIAVVIDGVCMRGHEYEPTGAVLSYNNPNHRAFWVGMDVETLKANHFHYSHTDTVYHGFKSGKEYGQFDDGSWYRVDENGETEVRGTVEIVEQ